MFLSFSCLACAARLPPRSRLFLALTAARLGSARHDSSLCLRIAHGLHSDGGKFCYKFCCKKLFARTRLRTILTKFRSRSVRVVLQFWREMTIKKNSQLLLLTLCFAWSCFSLRCGSRLPFIAHRSFEARPRACFPSVCTLTA